MFSAILSLLGGVFPKLLDRYLDYKRRQYDISAAIQMAEIQAGLELGQAQIQATSSTFKEKLVTTVALGPLYLAFTEGLLNGILVLFGLSPLPISLTSYMFSQLSGIPASYLGMMYSIIFAVWGIQVGRGPISAIFQGISDTYRNRRAMAQAVNSLDIDKKTLFDTLHHVTDSGRGSAKSVPYYQELLNRAASKVQAPERTDEWKDKDDSL